MRGRLLPLLVLTVPLAFASCVTIRPPTQGQPSGAPGAGGQPEAPTGGGPRPEGVRADESAALEAAVASVNLAQPAVGRAALEAFLARYPRSPQRPVAAAHLARLALAEGDARRARDLLPPAASDGGQGVVSFVQGLIEARVGQPARALTLLAPFASDGPPRAIPDRDDAEQALNAALAEARLGAGDPGGALAAWEIYGGRRARPAERAFAQERADELAARLTDAEAERLWESNRADFARAALGPHAAAAARTRGDANAARRFEEETTSLRRSLDWASTPKALGPGDPYRLGLLAPFSGAAALLGEIILRGAMMAIGDRSGNANAPFQIVARDAASERGTGGERAAAEIVREEAAVAVVGVGDRTAAAAAAREGVPVLLLDEAAPGAASTAFQVLHPPEIRAAELARRALAMGARRFAVLAPESAVGRRLGDAFMRAVSVGGGKIAAQATYPPGSSGFSAPVAKIKRATFEAIFVADDASRLELVAPALAAADLWAQPYGTPAPGPAAPGVPARRPVLLLSPAVGAGPQLLRNAGRYVQGALLAPGFFADTEDPRTAPFVGQFRTLYGQDPGATDAYGFDAFRLLVNAILRGGKSRADLLRTLATDPFEGVTGTIKFGPDHTRVDPPPIYVVVGDSIRALR
jgi:branched-chain amino acid transport system substrate-binding protein